ncbi:MAG: hypothetical protein GYA14_07765 [Ignavibacteria bacterium]|nr:hypothetical protein [Ignavibacteria bacterium]
MKKTGVLLSALIITALILNLFPIQAEINPGDIEDPLGIGINPADIPQTPEYAANISLTYLQKEWTKIVAKNKYIGPIHNFFLAHPTAFIVLFNYKYEFSLTFICIFIFWIFLAVVFGNIINSLGLLKLGLPWIFGALCSIILSQMGLIKLVTDSMLNAIFLQSLWWMRAILWFVALIVLIIVFYISQLASQTIAQSKKRGEEREQKEKVEELEEISKGARLE